MSYELQKVFFSVRVAPGKEFSMQVYLIILGHEVILERKLFFDAWNQALETLPEYSNCLNLPLDKAGNGAL